ncbi:hypothetical protein [Trueperella pyogenes]
MKTTRTPIALALALIAITTACTEKADVPYVKHLDCKTALTRLEEAGFTNAILVVQGAEDTPVNADEFKHCTIVKQAPDDGENTAISTQIKAIAKPENILREALNTCGPTQHAQLADNDKTLTLDGRGETSSGLTLERTKCYLDYLDAPERVRSAMRKTRALDGRQHATWDNLTAEWSFHPDAGLDIIIYTKE